LMLKKIKLNIGQNWQMTLYAHLFVPNKIKILSWLRGIEKGKNSL
jgi:hypothetical protein